MPDQTQNPAPPIVGLPTRITEGGKVVNPLPPPPVQGKTLPPPITKAPPPPPPATPRRTLLPSELRGVAYLTGMRGVGKSFLAAQADIPDNVLFWDFEEKGSGIDAQLHFGKYLSISSLAAKQFGMDFKPDQMYTVIQQELNKVETNRYSVAVIDNIEPLETAFLNQIKKYPMQYGISANNAQSGAFGGAWPGVNYLVSGFCNALYSRGVRLIIVTAHLKSVWSATGPIPNKFKPKGVERWHELSILSLVLITAESAPIPSGLVQKEQLASARFNEETGEIEVVRRLPLRLSKCTFSEIRRYLKEPADIRQPKPGETPTEDETSPFSDKFSKDQMAFLISANQAQAAGRPEDRED